MLFAFVLLPAYGAYKNVFLLARVAHSDSEGFDFRSEDTRSVTGKRKAKGSEPFLLRNEFKHSIVSDFSR